jgi:hypothetical protein
MPFVCRNHFVINGAVNFWEMMFHIETIVFRIASIRSIKTLIQFR